MRITAVEEYGLRCLLNLAKRGTKEQMSITEIAEAEGLSVPYASKLLSLLRKAGLVDAIRGRNGGFVIAKEPKDVSLYEVLTSLGGPLIDPNHCKKYSGVLDKCVHIDFCSVHDLLGGLAGYIQAFLSTTNLQQVVDSDPLVPPDHSMESFEISDTALDDEFKMLDANNNNNEQKTTLHKES